MSAEKNITHRQTVDCRTVCDMMFDYIDGNLSPENANAVERHLASCLACKLEISRVNGAEQALRTAAAALPLAGDLYTGFARKLSESSNPNPYRKGLWLAGALPAFAAVCIAGFVMIHGRHSVDQGVNVVVAPQATPTAKSLDSLDQDSALSRGVPPKIPLPATSVPVQRIARARRDTVGAMRKMSQTLVASNASRSSVFGTSYVVREPVTKRYRASDQPVADRVVRSVEIASQTTTSLSAAVDTASIQLQNDGYTDGLALLNRSLPTRDGGGSLAEVPAQSGFALVVQDDERGFTSEVHGALSGSASSSQAKGTIGMDSGVHVEVQLDDQ